MQDDKAAKLIKKYLAGTCTEQEKAMVENWYRQTAGKNEADISPEELENILAGIWSDLPVHKAKVRPLWTRIAAAASILLIISVSGFFLLHKPKAVKPLADNQPVNIKPGGNKAILTLSNGRNISLTDAKNGKVAAQGNAIVKKTSAGTVEYETADNNNSNAVEPIYNTLTTPRGGRFEGLLPDGTHVILDAASSIKYQVNVTGKDRIVWTTGQVHFHVNYNADRPFYVNVKGQTMKDLGTDFNVNAYDDEPVVAVTLEEGSVNVTKKTQSVTLIPGQQATTKANDDKITVQSVNVDNVIAWTKGKISFQNEDIQKIMREVSRWYDVDVQYEGQIPNRQFDGSIARNANLADLLKILEFENIHFTVSGKTITVKP